MTQLPPSQTADKIVVRLPDGMRDKLAELARGNGRSTNAEVVAALTSWVEGRWDHGGKQKIDQGIIDRVADRLLRSIQDKVDKVAITRHSDD